MNFTFQGMLLLASFLIGSIPFGLLVARVFKVKDLTSRGSGNIGATNVTRVVGFWPAGFLTFMLDVVKGAAPVATVAYSGLPEWLASLTQVPNAMAQVTPLLLWSIGFAAVLGHCFSPWLQFRGGKGVATGFGVMLMLYPLAGLFGILGFAYTFVRTRTGSLSSMAGLGLASITYLVMHPVGAEILPGAALIFIILVRHESNLNALLESREKSF